MNKVSRYEKYECIKTARKKYNKKYYGQSANKCPKREWTCTEIDKILKHEKTDRELSKELHRSVSAIQQKRCKLTKNNKIVQNAQNNENKTVCIADENGVHYPCPVCGKLHDDELDATLHCL